MARSLSSLLHRLPHGSLDGALHGPLHDGATLRSTFRARSTGAVLAAALALAVLGGCAGNPAVRPDARYDFGPPPQIANSGSMPAVKVLDVTAPETMASDKLTYRLSYADAQQTASYADSHWTMQPSALLTLRLRDALSQRGTVLTGSDGVRAPVLRVELTEFEQVFDSQTQSHGAVAARVTLTQSGKVVAQRNFVAQALAGTADAAGGARALATASDDVVAQISAWLGTQAVVAGQ
jgi:cholesterol transport system auxiliary component